MYKVFLFTEYDFDIALFRSSKQKILRVSKNIFNLYLDKGKFSLEFYEKSKEFELVFCEHFYPATLITMDIYAIFDKKEDAVYFGLKNV